MNRLISEIIPHVGTARDYRYHGSLAERRRYGNCYAFHLFLGGGNRAYMKVDDQTIPLDKGTLVFIRPGTSHSFHVSPEFPISSQNVYCDLWQQERFASDMPQFTFPPSIYRPESATRQLPCAELDQLPVAVSLAAYPHLLDNFAYISRTAEQPRPYRQKLLDSLFYAWLLELHHILFSPQPRDRRILRILKEIEAHPEQSAGHEKWIRDCGLQKSYFYKLFKQETGMSVHEYVIQERLKKAAVLLQETTSTITEVAALTGYASIHHFTRQFTARFGVSPSKYRKST